MHNNSPDQWRLDMLTRAIFVEGTAGIDASKAYFWLGVLHGKMAMVRRPEFLLMPLVVIESVKSSNIESIGSTVLDQLQVQIKGRIPVGAEQKLTAHYQEALLAGFEYVQNTGKFDLELIVLIQQILLPGSSGIRDTEPIVIANTVSGEVLWSPPVGRKKILDYVTDWLRWAREPGGIDVLIAVGLLHSQFEAIHPFLDGNGRTGRILIILYLIYHKILDYPCLFISDAILKTRTYYYLALQESQKMKKHTDIVQYMLQAIEDKAQHSCTVIDGINELKIWFEAELHTKTTIYSHELVEYLIQNPFYTISALCEYVQVSRNTGSRYLEILVQKHIIQVRPARKNKLFYNQAFLSLLS